MTRLTNTDAMRIANDRRARRFLAGETPDDIGIEVTPEGDVAADSIPELIDRAQAWALVCTVQGYDEWSTRGHVFRRLAAELTKARAVIADLEQLVPGSELGRIYAHHDFDPGQST